jgi:hypothetical protein
MVDHGGNYAHRSRESDKRGLAECEVLTFLKYQLYMAASGVNDHKNLQWHWRTSLVNKGDQIEKKN